MFARTTIEERGQSEVVGTLLLVAVVVFLGTVVGAFSFGITEEIGEDNPDAVFAFDYESEPDKHSDDDKYAEEILKITHTHGDTIRGGELIVRIEDVDARDSDSSTTSPVDFSNEVNGEYTWSGAMQGSESVSVGDSVRIDQDTPYEYQRVSPTGSIELDLSEATVTLIWKPANINRAYLLHEWEGPNV